MINDYLWTALYAQREAELRASARRRGGDPASASTRLGLLGRLRLGRRVAAARPAPAAVRGAASDAPTAAAEAWARLASGAGTLEPATSSRTEQERDAA